MSLHRLVIFNVIFTTCAVAIISAEVHKGYSHAAIHNKHGGKFAYKIHHVYHPKNHGHGGGGGHGHKHEGVLYHKQHNNFDDDFEEGNRNYLFDDFQKAEDNNEFDYKSLFPTLEDVYNQYSANEFNQLFKTEPATFNNIDNFENSNDFGKNRNLDYSKSFGYSFAYPNSLAN